MKVRYRIYVSGVVQGVSFRAFVRRNALSHGVSGWAKNLDDGRVEIILEGEKEEVEKVLEACRKGPPLAAVRDIEIKVEKPEGISGFFIY